MSCFRAILLFALLGFTLLGCKRPHPNPESLDPIYKDLAGRQAAHAKAIEDTNKQIVEIKTKLASTEPNSIERKDVQREFAAATAKLLNSQQWERYYRIRAERRKLQGKIDYQKAFAQDRVWPPKDEYSQYMTNIRLREVNLNWNSRVPKLQNRRISSKPPESEPKASGGH